jgi:hypothetical protein
MVKRERLNVKREERLVALSMEAAGGGGQLRLRQNARVSTRH